MVRMDVCADPVIFEHDFRLKSGRPVEFVLKHFFANTFIITKKEEWRLIPGADLMCVHPINGAAGTTASAVCHRHNPCTTEGRTNPVYPVIKC